MAFSKILIANRGEIACRVMRTVARMGYRSVAVYSDADAGAAHVAAADEAVRLGPPPAGESYLAIDRVIAAASRSGADAIHPGYGFLSENASFASACAAAGVTFIGPPAAAIELMGNKRAAKLAMLAAVVPCVPGYNGEDQSPETFAREALRIGFPVMVKAAAGGGGRGMRVVAAPVDLREALSSARAEAESAFGSGELILERAVVAPRHVEIQIFADAHGNVVHLGERDCSIQRRHQKVIEESPSPAVDAALRSRMGAAAVQAARACGYVGAGTVELLLDRDGSFYFLEMNTRLQVEHPVTELVTGLDLVEWQIRVARGEPLPLAQDAIVMRGHAIEARLYAEDPARAFLPQTGRVLTWRLPAGCDVRIDHGLHEGAEVSPHYDPLLAKVVAHGSSREDARKKLAHALGELTLFGVVSNKSFLAQVCEHAAFAAGTATTAFLTEHFDARAPAAGSVRAPAPTLAELAPAALVVLVEGARGLIEDHSFLAWRSGGPVWTAVKLELGEREHALRISRVRSDVHRFRVSAAADDAVWAHIDLIGARDGVLTFEQDGVRRTLRYAMDGDTVWSDDGVNVCAYRNVTHAPARRQEEEGSGRLAAPLDGKIQRIVVSAGDAVTRGQLVMVMEAMKMEHRIESDVVGKVREIHARLGEQVKTRQLLAEIEPAQRAEGGQ